MPILMKKMICPAKEALQWKCVKRKRDFKAIPIKRCSSILTFVLIFDHKSRDPKRSAFWVPFFCQVVTAGAD
ncbi:hypothetical protein CX649_07575 [Bacillaceae bacterium ZC4]|nr:hypothetical protein CX649_07575 [Bacillaceae bacterium ZC4]